eukprot:751290-Hanusia_phi.AAC.1
MLSNTLLAAVLRFIQVRFDLWARGDRTVQGRARRPGHGARPGSSGRTAAAAKFRVPGVHQLPSSCQ